MAGRVLVAGIGNVLLSDDGFGPEVVRLLAEQDALLEDVRVVDYGIRGMHLAYDLLDGYDALVLVDAVPSGGSPGEVSVLQVGEDDLQAGSFDPHGMDPAAVLGSLHQLGGRLPPTFVVGCRPESVVEGIGLSPPVTAALPKAIAAVRSLVGERGVLRERGWLGERGVV